MGHLYLITYPDGYSYSTRMTRTQAFFHRLYLWRRWGAGYKVERKPRAKVRVVKRADFSK